MMINSTHCSPRYHAHELKPCHDPYDTVNGIHNKQPQFGSNMFSNTNTPLLRPIFQPNNLSSEGIIPRASEKFHQNIQMPTVTLSEAPTMPRDPEMLKNIDYLSSCVVKQGLIFEKMIQEKEANNPKFGFLFESEQGTEAAIGKLYYEWKKNALQATFHPQTPILSKKNIDSEPPSNNCCSSHVQKHGVNTHVLHNQVSTSSGEMDMDLEDNGMELNTIQIEDSKYVEEMPKVPIITRQDRSNSNLYPTLEKETSRGSFANDEVKDIPLKNKDILELNEKSKSHSTYCNIYNGLHQVCDGNLFQNPSNTSPSSCGTPILESTFSDKGDLLTNFSMKKSMAVVEKITLDSHHNLDELQNEVGSVSITVLKEGHSLEANMERIQIDRGDEKLSLNKDYELKDSSSNCSEEKEPLLLPDNSNNVVVDEFYQSPITNISHEESIHKLQNFDSKNNIGNDIEEEHWHSSETKTQYQVVDNHCGEPLSYDLNQQTPIEALISSKTSPHSLSNYKVRSKSKFDLDEFGRRMKIETDSENEENKSTIAKKQYKDEECFSNKKRHFDTQQYESRSQHFSQSPQSQSNRHLRKRGKYGRCIYYAKGHCRRGHNCWFEHTNFENDKKSRKKRNSCSESCDYRREKNSYDASGENHCRNISSQKNAKTQNIENELGLSFNNDIEYCEVQTKSFDNDRHKRSNLLTEHNDFVDELHNSDLPSYNVEKDKFINQEEEKIEDKEENNNSCDDCSNLQSEDSKSSQNIREFSFEKNINHLEGLSMCHNPKKVGVHEDYRESIIESPNNSKGFKMLQTRELSAPETTVSSDHFSAVSSTASLEHTKDSPMLISPTIKTLVQPQISQLPNLTTLPIESSISSQIPQFSNPTFLEQSLVPQVSYASRVTNSLPPQIPIQTSMSQHIPIQSSIPQVPIQTSILPQVSLQNSMLPQVSLQNSMQPQICQAPNRSPPILNDQREPFSTSLDNNIGNFANSTSINSLTPNPNPFQMNMHEHAFMPHLSSNNHDVVHSSPMLSRLPTIGFVDHFSYPPPIPYPKLYTPISQNIRIQHDNIIPSQLYHSTSIMQHRDQNPLPSFPNPQLSYKNIHIPLSSQPQHYNYHGNSKYLLQPLNNRQSPQSNTWPQHQSYLMNSTPQGSYSSQVQNDIRTNFKGPLLTTTTQYMNKGFDTQPPHSVSYTSISNPTTLTYSIQPTHVPSVVQQDYGVPPLLPSSFDSYPSTKYNTFQSYPPTQLYTSLQKPYTESKSLENEPYEVRNTHPTSITMHPSKILQKQDELQPYALETSNFENVSPIGGGQSWTKPKEEKTLEGDAFECIKHNEKDKIQKESHIKIHGLSLLKKAIGGYVKELLKPQWREGHMTKEAYKTIIKKTVSKVVGTVKLDNVPNNDEKVASYMDGARPKILKLAQVVVQLTPSKIKG